uniref:Cation efflux protein transmembrane domain-containing protein n=1 Tax=Romanomermis culicivorax TaxID=13658 RepID=A0A915I8E7_ROMCU
MSNVSIMCDSTEKICLIGVFFEACTLLGLLVNFFLISIFIKNRYHQNDPALILSLSLLFCDCGHLLMCIVHVGPELIVNFEVEKSIDPFISFGIFYFWVANLFHLAYICFRKDYYLEYVLHVLHGTLILWMIWAYSKCIFHMKQASKRILPGVLGALMAVHQRRNFRICINYLIITVLFIILVITWVMFELIEPTWITASSKKLAYIANSITPALMFLTTNPMIKRDTAAVISGYRNSIFESVSKIKDWKFRSTSNVRKL